MTITDVLIVNIAANTDWPLKRTYKTPVGLTIVKAWLTVKRYEVDADPGLFQKSITTLLSVSGQITDDSSSDSYIAMQFFMQPADTAAAKLDVPYWYDIQVKRATGEIEQIEKGSITFIRRITQANA